MYACLDCLSPSKDIYCDKCASGLPHMDEYNDPMPVDEMMNEVIFDV